MCNTKTEQREQHLSADSVGRPEGHGQRFTVATDEVTVVEDGVFGVKKDSRSTKRQVPAV